MADSESGPSSIELQLETSNPDIIIPEAPFLSDPCDEDFFLCSAEALAVKLLGQYLYFHDSRIAVRILETEAYPLDDMVFTKKYIVADSNLVAMMMRGEFLSGTLLLEQPSGELIVTVAAPVIKAGMVLIRSCEPVLGHEEIVKNRKNPRSKKHQKNLLIGPLKVAQGVLGTGKQSWLSNNELFKEGGAQLFYGKRGEGEHTKRGKRVLDCLEYYKCEGRHSLLRFALATKSEYKYSKKCGGLKDWQPEQAM